MLFCVHLLVLQSQVIILSGLLVTKAIFVIYAIVNGKTLIRAALKPHIHMFCCMPLIYCVLGNIFRIVEDAYLKLWIEGEEEGLSCAIKAITDFKGLRC